MKNAFFKIGVIIAAVLAGTAVLSLPVMLLWDWLMPVLFKLPEITWPQAWGLGLLCSLLFKNTTNH